MTVTTSSIPSLGIYHFQQSGIYQLTCNEDLLANITVLHNFLLPPNQHKRYKELIYTHGALMFLSFALIIPLGALLAHFKKPVVHMILQPLALVLACISFILAVVYKELNGEPHLNQLHNVVGLMLLTVAILVMPSLKIFVIAPITEKWRKIVSIWHKRLGLATIFFGLFNILLVSSLLNVVRQSSCVYFQSGTTCNISSSVLLHCLRTMGGFMHCYLCHQRCICEKFFKIT